MAKGKGFFSRIRNAISSTLNDAVDSVSDPGQEIALMLDELAEQIKKSEADLHQAIVDRKLMEKKLEEARKKEQGWQERAEQALRLGDEALARKALEAKKDATIVLQDAQAALDDQGRVVESMREQIRVSKAKLQGLNLRRGSLMAQARAAKRGSSPAQQMSGSGPLGRIDAIEQRIAELESLNEATRETMGHAAEEADMDAKLAALETRSALDDELDALKAKLAGRNQLPEGKPE
jgi:phage shock protein A